MILLSPYWLIATLLIVVFYLAVKKKAANDDWGKVISKPVLNALRPQAPSGNRSLLALLIAAIISLSLTAPAIESKGETPLKTHAAGWIVLVDLSQSMAHDDISPSRLSSARNVLQTLSSLAKSRPMALVGFSGDAFLLQPLSFDRQTFNEASKALALDWINLDGSRIDRALALALSMIQESNLAHARILLLSDSADITNDSIHLAKQLGNVGHQLDVILTGLPSSKAPFAVDSEAANKLVAQAHGRVIELDALGQTSGPGFADDNQLFEQKALQDLDISIGHYTLLSQWLVLLCLPLVLLWMRRGNR